MKVNNFAALREHAREVGPKRVAVVMAENDVALTALARAVECGIAQAVLIGHRKQVAARLDALELNALREHADIVHRDEPESAARHAVALARSGEIDILLKGQLRTDQLLRTALDREHGLRTGNLLSDVLIYEDTLSGTRRFVGITDGGINVLPDFEQKKGIVANAVLVMQALGFERPRIALMSATEAVSEAVPSTVEARRLTELAETGVFGNCKVFGPLALDNALLASAAQAKGICSPVAGHADVMVAPNIEAGNILGKAVKYFLSSQCAHVIVGASIPILIPSRVESADDKLNAIALGALIHG